MEQAQQETKRQTQTVQEETRQDKELEAGRVRAESWQLCIKIDNTLPKTWARVSSSPPGGWLQYRS